MKYLLIGLALMSSISTYACSCYGPSFGEKEVKEAVLSFMETKRKVESEDIKSTKVEFVAEYLTRRDRLVLSTLGALDAIGTDEAINECDRACTAAQNQKYKVNVDYINGSGVSCSQELEVSLESNYLSEGHKSIVKKNLHPVCEN